MGNASNIRLNKRGYFKQLFKDVTKSYQLYLIFLLPFIWFIVFKYYPMCGAQIAFRKYVTVKGMWGSEWIGLFNFIKFFKSPQFERVLTNTIGISFYQLGLGFPIPIILALMINNCRSIRFKKTVQMITYAPHFISTVVIVGMIVQFLSPNVGVINRFITILGGETVSFMSEPKMFKSIFVFTNIWQRAGWGTIIYISALASIDPSLHEAAIVDGASKFQRTIHIDLPGILPTAVALLILSTGRIMNVGFEKVFLMQNQLNISSSEIIQTYVYKVAFQSTIPNFSYATAIGLFNSVINLALIILVNAISKKVTDNGLW